MIRAVARGYFEHGQYDDAEMAAGWGGTWQEQEPELAWIRAQVATFHAQHDESLRWAQAVLQHAPDHAEARALVDRLQPRKKGWLW